MLNHYKNLIQKKNKKIYLHKVDILNKIETR